jgi:hypothetical protein
LKYALFLGAAFFDEIYSATRYGLLKEPLSIVWHRTLGPEEEYRPFTDFARLIKGTAAHDNPTFISTQRQLSTPLS